MRQLAEEEDEARLHAKGEPNRGKRRDKGLESPGGEQRSYGSHARMLELRYETRVDDEAVYLETSNEIPGYIHVGHDRRPGSGGRLIVM